MVYHYIYRKTFYIDVDLQIQSKNDKMDKKYLTSFLQAAKISVANFSETGILRSLSRQLLIIHFIAKNVCFNSVQAIGTLKKKRFIITIELLQCSSSFSHFYIFNVLQTSKQRPLVDMFVAVQLSWFIFVSTRCHINFGVNMTQRYPKLKFSIYLKTFNRELVKT